LPETAATSPAAEPRTVETPAFPPGVEAKLILRHRTRRIVPVGQGGRPYVKATFYLLPEQELAIEEIRLQLRREGDRDIDKSMLVREAIELLGKKYKRAE
jgi:hypothetical protein